MGVVRRAGVRRDCTCLRARHQHGTRGAYQADRCSCSECCAAWARYIKQWKHRKNSGSTTIPAELYVRKLRALSALGYSERMLAAEMGVSRTTFRVLLRSGRVFTRTAERVDSTYDRLSMKVPEVTKSSRQARARAARRGVLPPLAYDEEMNPVVARDGRYHWQADLDFLLSCGESEEQALKQLGRTRSALEKAGARSRERVAQARERGAS